MASSPSLDQGEKTDGWPCPSCTTINTIDNLNCQMCMEPKPGRKVDLQAEQDKFASATGIVKVPWTQRFKSLFTTGPPNWTCPNCTLENGGYYTKCIACGFLKESEQPKKKRRTSNDDWNITGVLSSLSSFFRGKNTNSTVVPDSGPRWKCSNCPLENNLDKADVCDACGAPRPSMVEELDINGDTVKLHHLDQLIARVSHDSGLESLPESSRTTPRHMSDDSSTSSHRGGSQHSNNGSTKFTSSFSSSRSKEVDPFEAESGVYDPTSPHYPSMPAIQESSHEHVQFSSMVSDRQTWRCTICGAYNLQKLPKCFVCGIGNNPKPPPPPPLHPKPDPPNHMMNHDSSKDQSKSSDQAAASDDRPRHRRENGVRNKFLHRLESNSNSLTEISHRNNCTTLILAQRQQAELEASVNFEAIRKYCKKHNEPFTDPDFPPADRSLYVNTEAPVTHWKVSQWLRPRNVSDPSASFLTKWEVFRNPRPEDMTQGVLGNCWIISALTVIAEQPSLIQEILLTKKYSTEGAYQVRLCKDGKWQVVVVDDCLPCFKNKQLVFSKALRKQLWVPLIEKALAKLYGSYEALNAGRVLSGLSILTGLPCEKIYLKKQSPNDNEVDYDIIWAQMLSFREQGFPMGASCGGHDINEEDYYKTGLEPNHAYSILDIRQLDGFDESYRLIRLRNPWGKYSWKGAWSDKDRRWTPWLREHLQAMGAEAGIFWMDVCDFYRYFCEVDVCKYRPDWYSTRMDGKLLPYVPRQQRLLAFEVNTATEVDISLYQPSLRGGPASQYLVDLAVLVMRYPIASDISDNMDPESIPLPISCAIASGSHIHSVITSTGFLEPGRYVILPLSFSHYQQPSAKFQEHLHSSYDMSDEGSVPYVVALFCARNLYYDYVLTRPGFMAESLFVLAQSYGTVSEPFPKMRLHEVYLRHSCRVLVAVNEDPHYHFTVTCDGVQSTNILSSRGQLYTNDCIPPMHRQVVLVLTQLEASQPYSVHMRIEFNKSEHNSEGSWGALHLPSLHPGITELHSPRLN